MVTPPGRRPRVSRVDGHPRPAATRVDPFPGAGVVSHAARSCEEPTAVIMVMDADQAETDLAAGTLTCPRCGGRLRPWSWATARLVRQLDGTTPRLRPRRARCQACRGTQVLLPGWCLPRRADAAEVIGAALLAHATGAGHRAIAAKLRRPQATVRRWLRAAGAQHTQWLRTRGIQAAARLDLDHRHHRRPAPRTLRMIIKPRFPGTPCPQPALTAQTNRRHRAHHAVTATNEPGKTVSVHRHLQRRHHLHLQRRSTKRRPHPGITEMAGGIQHPSATPFTAYGGMPGHLYHRNPADQPTNIETHPPYRTGNEPHPDGNPATPTHPPTP